MKKELFSIGQISKIKGITIKALRFYEKTGVIKPYYTDPATKYRYYALQQFIEFDVIRALRSIDVSPKDIKSILGKRDTGLLLEYLEKQKENARQKISVLQKTIKTIELARNAINNAIAMPVSQEIITRELPERLSICREINKPFSEKETLIHYSEFPMIIEKNRLLDTYITGIALLQDEKNEFHPAFIFNIVMANKNSNKKVLFTIPAGNYVCVDYSRQNINSQQQKLYEYLNQRALIPKLILQIDLLNDLFETANQCFEMQVLV